MENKEILEATIKSLEEQVGQLSVSLKAKQQELNNLNKPKMSKSIYEEIEDSVYNNMVDALNRLSENDYDLELELNGNEISVYGIDFHDTNSISEYIMANIDDKFNVVEIEDVDEDPSYDEMKENKVLSEA